MTSNDNSTRPMNHSDAKCPECGEPPFDPYEVQEDGPGVVLVCLQDHHFVYFEDNGETRMVGL